MWPIFSRILTYPNRSSVRIIRGMCLGSANSDLCIAWVMAVLHGTSHGDIIKQRHFPCYWPFVRGIHQSLVDSPHKGQWHRALMFSLICAWTNGWANNQDASDLRRLHTNYDVTVMMLYWTVWKRHPTVLGNHKRHPIPCLHKWTVGCLLWVSQRKIYYVMKWFKRSMFFFDMTSPICPWTTWAHGPRQQHSRNLLVLFRKILITSWYTSTVQQWKCIISYLLFIRYFHVHNINQKKVFFIHHLIWCVKQ